MFPELSRVLSRQGKPRTSVVEFIGVGERRFQAQPSVLPFLASIRTPHEHRR